MYTYLSLCIFFPYTTCFFPQPEKPTSRAPFFLQKLATLLFTGLPLLDPSTAKLTHFITKNTSSQTLCTRQVYSSSLLHQTPFTPDTTSHAQAVSFHSQKSPKVEPLFLEKIGNSTFHWFTSSGPLYSETYSLHKPKHVIPNALTSLFQQPFTPNTFYTGHNIPNITCFFP